MKLAKPYVGILSHHPAPYRDSTYSTLVKRGVIDVLVLNIFQQDRGHSYWNLHQPTYPNINLNASQRILKYCLLHHMTFQYLRRNRFDVVVIPGYRNAPCVSSLIYCWLTRTPFIFSCDSIAGSQLRYGLAYLRNSLSQRILDRASAFWVPGEASRQHLCSQGFKNEHIFEGCYTLDYIFIRDEVERNKKHRSRTRRDLSINENGFVFLMVANVLSNRRHDLLLESFSQVVVACPNSYLLLVGKGADQKTIMHLSNGRQIRNVRTVGPAAFAELAPLFTASDAYVHSGSEPYSTAVQYAAIAGLPIVTTPNVGAAKDYVIDVETGYIAPSEDVSGFAERMLLLARDPKMAQSYGSKARELASKFTAEWAADQLEEAVLNSVQS